MAAFDTYVKKTQRDEDFEEGYASGKRARQSEIDALKAQVEELNGKLMLAEIRAERADIDHARQPTER